MTKIAIVTGASRGLGKEMALQLAAKGRDLILTYHSKQDEAHEVVAQIEKMGRRAVVLQLDTSKSATFPAFAKTSGARSAKLSGSRNSIFWSTTRASEFRNRSWKRPKRSLIRW